MSEPERRVNLGGGRSTKPLRGLSLALPLLEIAILALGASLLARVALKPPVVRDFRTYLPWSAVVATAGLAALVLAAWLVVRWPAVRHATAFATLAAIVFARARAGTAYGRRRGWPAGSLGMAESFDAIGDRDYYRERAREYGPVFKTSQFGRPVACVHGLELAREVLRDTEALAGATLPYNRFLPDGSLRYMGSRVHDEEAPFFRAALSAVDLSRHEGIARETCARMLAGLSARSIECPEGSAPRADLHGWVFIVLASIFWGLGPDDPRLVELDEAQRGLRLGRGGGPRWRRELRAGLDRINALMRARSAEPDLAVSGSDRANALGAVLAADPNALDNPTRAHNLSLVFRLGLADSTSFLDWIVAMLGDHAEWQDRIRGEARRAIGVRPEGRDTVAGRFVHETLRLEQSEYLYREVARPLTIAGHNIPRGWLLRVLVQESHRDPSIFPEPDTFDADRFAGAERSRREYSPFGVDDHGCMGVPIVHFLANVLLEEVCHGYDLRVLRQAPPEKGTRHRDHWRPGSSRRIRLTPLEADGPHGSAGSGS
ncbi:MAG: cytochrome P450 [Gemmatimonadota bacterium]|nr:cytochrome P450 [Gemmatimonadota bacterium]